MPDCPTCRKPGEGEYCSQCGEDLQPDRITVRYVLTQFAEIFVGFESNRLLHTFRDLTFRPGTTIRRYLRGTRQSYYNPVDYVLLMGGLSILLSLFLNESIFDGSKAEAVRMAENKAFMSFLMDDVGTFFNLMLIFQFPIAGFLTWLRRSKGHHTLGEHIYANAYLSGQVLAFNLLFLALQRALPVNGFLLFLSELYGWFIMSYVSFSYFRWRHGNLKFPRVIWSVTFMIMVYGVSLFIGLLLAIGYFYLLFRWQSA